VECTEPDDPDDPDVPLPPEELEDDALVPDDEEALPPPVDEPLLAPPEPELEPVPPTPGPLDPPHAASVSAAAMPAENAPGNPR